MTRKMYVLIQGWGVVLVDVRRVDPSRDFGHWRSPTKKTHLHFVEPMSYKRSRFFSDNVVDVTLTAGQYFATSRWTTLHSTLPWSPIPIFRGTSMNMGTLTCRSASRPMTVRGRFNPTVSSWTSIPCGISILISSSTNLIFFVRTKKNRTFFLRYVGIQPVWTCKTL